MMKRKQGSTLTLCQQQDLFFLNVGNKNFGTAETNDHHCMCCGKMMLRNHAPRRITVGYVVDEKMTHWT